MCSSLNDTGWNASSSPTTPAAATTSLQEHGALPEKGESEKEHHYSMNIFFILLVVG